MKTRILVPTDFSDCAHNALDYALGLSADLNAEIVLMHSIIYNDSSFIEESSIENENTLRYNEAKINIEKEFNYCKTKNPAIQVKTVLDSGPTELSVSSAIDQEKIHYVVMGTEGSSGLKSSIFGSFTSNVLLISPAPVFSIPPTGKYRGIQTIVCATEMDETEKKALKETMELTKKFNAHITFYNVNPSEEEQRVLLYKFERAIPELTDYTSIDYVTIESHDILESIENYVSEKQPDLVITLGKERSFFDKLFGKKVTKKLSLHTKLPLLSFPTYHKVSK